ncbi:MAG: hypothetical protein NTX53_08810 [candidate division WOR-3 bacterium]|nr:hypothetical protein [candidate division WOR-3 bacterium]
MSPRSTWATFPYEPRSKKTRRLFGQWWFPDAPVAKVAGVLTLTDGEYPVLSLIGDLADAAGQRVSAPEIINGFTTDCRMVTLYKSELRSQNSPEIAWTKPANRLPQLVYESLVFFDGWQFQSSSELAFNEFEFQWRHSGRWTTGSARHIPWRQFSDTAAGIAGATTPESPPDPKPAVVVVDGTEIRLEFRRYATSSTTCNVDDDEALWVSVRYKDPKGHDAIYWNEVRDLQDFLSFCMGVPAVPFRARAVCHLPGSEAGVLPRIVDVFPPGPRNDTDAARFDQVRLLSTFDDIADDFDKHMSWWLQRSPEWRLITTAFLSTRYGRLFMENQILSMTRALETLHRVEFASSGLLDNNTFTDLKDVLLDDVERLVPRDAACVLKERVGRLNVPELRLRFGDISKRVLATAGMQFANAEQVAGEVARLRNDVAHGLKRGVINDQNVDRAAVLVLLMTAWLESCLLEKLGLPSERIRDILREGGRLRWIERAHSGASGTAVRAGR